MIPLFADTVHTIVVEDRTEARVRAIPDARPGFDIMTMPKLGYEMRSRTWYASIAYDPVITLRDLENPDVPANQGGTGIEMLHQGSFVTAWRSRRTRIQLSEDGAYGDYNFTYLLPRALPTGVTMLPPQALPSVTRTLRFASTRTALASFFVLDRRVFFGVMPAFWASGGADEISREQLPFQITPRIDFMLDYVVSRREQLSTNVAAQAANFTERFCDPFDAGPPKQPTPTMPNPPLPVRCKADAEQIEAHETLRQRWDRNTDFQLSAGGAVVRQVITPVIKEKTRFYPTVSMTMTHRFPVMRPDRVEMDADARLEPVTDVRFGTVDPRIMVAFGTTTRIQRFRLRVSSQFAQTVPPDQLNALTMFMQEGEGLYRLTRTLSIGLGARAVWQRQPPILPSGFFSVVGYALLEYKDPRFLQW